MFAMQGPSNIECDIEELRSFLDDKVRQHELLFSGGQYGYQEVKQYRTTVQCKKYLFFIGYTLFNSTTSTYATYRPGSCKSKF